MAAPSSASNLQTGRTLDTSRVLAHVLLRPNFAPEPQDHIDFNLLAICLCCQVRVRHCEEEGFKVANIFYSLGGIS